MRLLTRPNSSVLSRSPGSLAIWLGLLLSVVSLFWLFAPTLPGNDVVEDIEIPQAAAPPAIPPPPQQPKHEAPAVNKASAYRPFGLPRNLHLLMHAPYTDVSLCKSITTSLILDYPMPRLVNWHRELETGNDNLNKFGAFANYLDKFPAQRNDDLVLIVDGYNTWFQLRPEVLIQRYLENNDNALKRLQLTPGDRRFTDASQQIVFAAQRECWPWSTKDSTCTATPESTLPMTIFGPDTDQYKGHERFPYATFRPRYLNSGAYIGRLGTMKALMARARQIARDDRKSNDKLGDMWASRDWSERNDQIVFQRIFREQELARQTGNCSEWGEAEKCEFKLGVDYESRLTQAHAMSEGDMVWKQHGELREKETAPASQYVAQLDPRDLLDVQKPFSNLEWEDQPGWDELSLHTNQFTNVVPALVHHNMDAENLLRVGEESWAKMWFHEKIWAMLDARASGHEVSKKVAVTEIAGEKIEWWTNVEVPHNRTGAYTEGDSFIPWSDLCGRWEEDVYRGNNGP